MQAGETGQQRVPADSVAALDDQGAVLCHRVVEVHYGILSVPWALHICKGDDTAARHGVFSVRGGTAGTGVRCGVVRLCGRSGFRGFPGNGPWTARSRR
ncbi:hypothetical protein GCM10022420_033190 [Streptomyces iranensis]